MERTIKAGHISGRVTVPPSKSMMQRVCAAALLKHGTTLIHNPGTSNDDKAALQIITQLGASVTQSDNGSLRVASRGVQPKGAVIDCGESGLSARLFTPVAALANGTVTITGHGSLLQRPMTETKNILGQLGVTVHDFNGYLPIRMTGPARPGDIFLDGSLSSQYVTGVLFALAFSADKPVTVFVNHLKSKPYIDLSLEVLSAFGHTIKHDHYKAFHIEPAQQRDEITELRIEADWSSAAGWIVAAAISGDIMLEGLDPHTTQADVQLLEVVSQCGAAVYWWDNLLHVKTSDVLQAFNFDATDCPDLFPVLSVLAAACNGTSEIKGLHRLVHKESNRSESIAYMLQQLGINFSEEGDSLLITGSETFATATIPSFNDHRMVMAAAVAGLRGQVTITGAEAVAKSYPAFFEHFNSLLQTQQA